ncbi:iron-sulfur cluster co-chaperone, putative [Ichthyophthirius multifiliis]|uniref:Iron-sulfur cluster co-chaperone, putative n=1 Tax=Ichthyophthirius multifiliis TaxID=5932 RepID=G0QQE4_ICHMU|nr:iron-sulfur cluster co-chaperone, putative [Ichthyophthirius multifiliis]EGR32553.1 iron-sulfur cluster co-chaperone, putative [Ichthyophthirius multifiliis]|eukprot:XP_004036539.1 iron-sulfur cluster co-chaperone, putative [Ichthyophthirius multifiliis]
MLFQKKVYNNTKPTFEINEKKLDQEYKKLQKCFHPDKYHSKSDKMLKFSETYSMYINEAYKALKDDLQRSEYLLNLLTHGKKDELLETIKDDEYFLKEVMEIRFEIEDCNNKDELDQHEQYVNQLKKETINKINQLLDQQDYQNAAIHIIKLRYHESTLENIKKIFEQIQNNKFQQQF